MPEIQTPVEVVQVVMSCPECGEPMTHTGYVQTSHPPKYPHECPNGHKETYFKVYPHLDYKPVEPSKPIEFRTPDYDDKPRW